VAVTPDGAFVYATSFNTDTVSVIATANNTITATIAVDAPAGVAMTPDGAFAYVAPFSAIRSRSSPPPRTSSSPPWQSETLTELSEQRDGQSTARSRVCCRSTGCASRHAPIDPRRESAGPQVRPAKRGHPGGRDVLDGWGQPRLILAR